MLIFYSRERQKNKKAMVRKSTCQEQEVRDRVKHKPVKQKVPVKKEKTEKSKGYDEKKVPVRK